MVVFPPCKINLGLNIVEKRNDGFHNLETFFYPVPITDVLEIIARPGNDADQFFPSGIQLPHGFQYNLVSKAIGLIRERFPKIPALDIYLHKVIPMGGGLGGGSSDGALALRLLNNLFELGLSPHFLLEMASKLGSDCPFFIYGKPAFATGRGEILELLEPVLQGYFVVLVNPNIEIPTPWAFKQITPAKPQYSLRELITQRPDTWKARLTNDFEPAVKKEFPVIGDIIEKLYEKGAVYAAMSGSGSTCYGIFDIEPEYPAGWFPDFWVRNARINR